MVTLLITSFLLLAAISFAIYCWQRISSHETSERALPPPPPPARGLFSDQDTDTARALEAEEGRKALEEKRARLLGRAAQGDRAALQESSEDPELYDEILAAFIERADDYQKLFALVSFIKRSEHLRVNARLAERFLNAWLAAPESRSPAIVLHLAASADSAPLYLRAAEAVFALWQEGRLQNISAEELRTLFDGEYWLLSADSRSSGAGFVLKQKLAQLRLELVKASQKSPL
ncbi:MAG TPA: hypothetical protein VF544_01890 [Pyrinomonadaceae bacterium]|jgi:hypothetical protein